MSQQHEPQPFGRICHICDGMDFTWGVVIGGSGRAKFVKQEDIGFFEGIYAAGQRMRARKCDTCQNIQLFGASEK